MLTWEVERTVREGQRQNPTLIQVLDHPIVYSSLTLSVPSSYNRGQLGQAKLHLTTLFRSPSKGFWSICCLIRLNKDSSPLPRVTTYTLYQSSVPTFQAPGLLIIILPTWCIAW